MAVFSSEAMVREKFQAADAAAGAGLVVQSLADAHEEILRALGDGVDTETPPAGLVLGETLLAGAHLLRSLASRTAITQRELRIAGNQAGPGKRFEELLALAAETESRGWQVLTPYLRSLPLSAPGTVTDTAEAQP